MCHNMACCLQESGSPKNHYCGVVFTNDPIIYACSGKSQDQDGADQATISQHPVSFLLLNIAKQWPMVCASIHAYVL